MTRYIGLEFDPYRPWNRGILRGVEGFAANRADWRLLPHRLIASQRIGLWGTRERADGILADTLPSWAPGLDIPLVCFQQAEEEHAFPVVTSDFRAIGELAAGYLAGKGYKTLSCFQRYVRPTLAEDLRDEGFRARARELSIEVVELSLPATEPGKPHYFRLESLDEHLHALRSLPRPCGLFARNLAEAYTLHFLISEAGLNMPNDIGLIAGGNDREQLDALRPSVTGISRNTYGLGYRGAEQLQRLFDGLEVESLVLLPPGGVVERESTRLDRIDDPVVARARAIMRERIGLKLSLGKLAGELGISERSLRRRFQAAVRRSPVEEVQQMRLARAKELLETSSATVSEVSGQCGFAESAQLSRAMKAATGLTPTQYRSHALRVMGERGGGGS